MTCKNRVNKFIAASILLSSTLIFSSNVFSQSILDPNAQVETIATGIQQPEGPVWKEGVGLLYSDIKASIIYKWTPETGNEVYINPSDSTNGLTYDLEGRLVAGQMGKRRIVRWEKDNSQTVLADNYLGKPFNSPNDLVVKSDGSIFFTDPDFNIPVGGKPEIKINGDDIKGIYRIYPGGNVQLLDYSFKLPNGICFSPDEKKLYVNESQLGEIYEFDLVDDTTITNKQLFAKLKYGGYADGMKTDPDGNIYCTGPRGIEVFSPDGTSIGFIYLPNNNSASNCTWGDADGKTLYITAGGQNKPVFKVRPLLTDVKEGHGSIIPHTFQLYQNFPNPFNPSTEISYALNKSSNVELKVFDMLGKSITTLVDEYKQPGVYHSTFSTQNSSLTSGIYYYTLTTNDFTETKKMIFLK